jgi:tetratricopeptide (TPR) repeat protein
MNHIGLSLKEIVFDRRSGFLVAGGPEGRKSFFFQDGSLIFAKTEDPEERLGPLLFRMGKINAEVLDAIPGWINSGQMLGETLVSKELISQKELFDALLSQMWTILLGLFPRFDVEFVFQPRERLMDMDFETKVHLLPLMETGLRQMGFRAEIAEFIAPRVLAPSGRGSALSLSDDEKALLGRLDGRRNARALLESVGLDPAFFWSTLYLFYCLDLAEERATPTVLLDDLVPPPRESAPRPEPTTGPDPDPEDAPRPVASAPEDKPAAESPSKRAGSEDPETSAALSEILSIHRRLADIDFYQVLSVERSAGEEEVKKAYFALARRFHPDRFGRHLPPGIKEQVDEVFDFITKAYRTLTNRDQKMTYASKLANPVHDDDKDRSKNAETRFRQGKTLFNQARYEESLVLLEEAVRLKDDKGDYYLLLAMAESKVAALSKKAERDFLRAIELEAWNPEGYVGLGMLYKREGLLLRARKQFERALEIDSDHKGARKGLSEMEDSPEAGKKAGFKGFLSKDLFGSKKK